MKIIKLLAGGIGLLVVIVIIVLGVFVATFDANRYKQELSDVVRDQTGRELSFQGDIGLTLYPDLGMKLGAMSVSNAKGFGKEPMFSVKQVSVSVDVFSLLKMQPEVDRLVLDGLNLNLHKKADGATNFDDLVKKPEQSGAASPGPSPDAPSAPKTEAPATSPSDQGPASVSQPWLAGSFGGLDIRRANLVWRDDTTGDVYRVRNLELLTGRITADSPFPLSLKLDADNREKLKAQVQLKTTVGFRDGRLSLGEMRLNSSAAGSMLPVDSAEVSLAGSFDYLLEAKKLSGKGFSLKLDSQGGIMKKVALAVAGEVGFDQAAMQLDVAVLDVAVDAEGEALPKGKIKAGLSASSMALVIPANSVRLNDLRLEVDGNRFEGFVHAADFTRPVVRFDLRSNRLDVDGLLGLPEQASEPVDNGKTADGGGSAPAGGNPETAPAPPPDVQIALPMELLRKLKLDGRLQIGELLVKRLTLTKLDLSLKADNGIVDIKPLKLDLYDGHYQAAIRVDVRADQPLYQIQKKLNGFQVGKFLKDFSGKDPVGGRTDLAIDLRTGGEWLSELKAGLNGSLDIAISDGALNGFNLRHQIDTVKAKFNRKDAPPLVERKTDFSALTLSGQVRDGVFSSNDLNLQAPIIRVGGEGSANLVEETVDYLVKAKLVTTTKGQSGGEADELSGLPIPVAITGPWLSPKIDVQYDEMIKAHLDAKKAKLKAKLEAEKAELKRKLEAEKAEAKLKLEAKKAEAKRKLAEEKARLEAEQRQKLEAEKARLEQQKQQALAEQKARLEAEKKAQEEKARDKLKDKLKKLF